MISQIPGQRGKRSLRLLRFIKPGMTAFSDNVTHVSRFTIFVVHILCSVQTGTTAA